MLLIYDIMELCAACTAHTGQHQHKMAAATNFYKHIYYVIKVHITILYVKIRTRVQLIFKSH